MVCDNRQTERWIAHPGRHRLGAPGTDDVKNLVLRRVDSEIALARQLLTLTREDSRIGFEPSCQYFYLPLDLVEKVVNCRWLLSVDAVR